LNYSEAMKTIRRILVGLGLIATLVLPTAAFAGNTSDTSGVLGSSGSGSGGALSESGGALPFTGLNLALIILAGLALVATGVLLRRRSATES
jgi:hypothetical protein